MKSLAVNVHEELDILFSTPKLILNGILWVLLEITLIVLVCIWHSGAEKHPPSLLEVVVVYGFIGLIGVAIIRLPGLLSSADTVALHLTPQGFKSRKQPFIPWTAVKNISLIDINPSAIFSPKVVAIYLKSEVKESFRFLGWKTKSVTLSSTIMKIEQKDLLAILNAYFQAAKDK